MPHTTLDAVDAAIAIDQLPDGSPIPTGLKHALMVLATYWPNIWPSVDRLARNMGIGERAAQKRLRELEQAGVITRQDRPGRTSRYRLNLPALQTDPVTIDSLIEMRQAADCFMAKTG
jgi:biotin operon repressor